MERTCILILGMHRSGTSPVTRVLSLLGAALPSNLLESSATENETGFWESADIVAIHDRFLSAIGSSWNDPRAIGQDAVDSEAGRRCRGELAALINRDFADCPLFVIKDPRIARLTPMWCRLLDELNIRRVAVIPVRNPLAVADSLARRNGFDRNTSLALWLRHVLEAEAASRGMRRAVLSYDGMLTDPEAALRPLCAQLGCFDADALNRALPEIREFLSSRYRHHLHSEADLLEDRSIPAWIRQVFVSLRAGDWGALDTIAGELNRSMELFSSMVDPRRDVALAEALSRSERLHARCDTAERALAEASSRSERLQVRCGAAERALAAAQGELDTLHEAARRADEYVSALEQITQRVVWAEKLADERRERMDVLTGHLEEVLAERRRLEGQVSILAGLMRQQANAALRTKVRRGAALIAMIPALLRGLLDTEWYGKGGRAGAVLHYLLVGRRRGVSPHALMDVDYYLRENPDVAASGSDPVCHYLRLGWREGRKPHPLFDTRYYLDVHQDVRRSGGNPLLHYIRHGWREQRNPNAWFDAAVYARHSGCRGNPLVHYVREGAASGLPSGPLFDAAEYLAANPDVAASGLDPLTHFIDFGRHEGREVRQKPAASAIPAKLRLLMISHGHGGGVGEHCRDLTARLQAEGCDVWLLEGMGAGHCRLIGGTGSHGYPYDTTSQAGAERLLDDLRRLRFDHVHYHHVIGFLPSITGVAGQLGLAYDVTLHDYAFACPRVTLLDGNARFCGGPRSEAECGACVARWGGHDGIQPLLTEVGGVPEWRDWARHFLAGARRVVVPDADMAARLEMFWPDLPLTVLPHPEPPMPIPVLPPPGGSRVRVAVIGGIGRHKGLHVLEACAQAALQAGLPLDFVVFGAVSANGRLRACGNVTIHGTYARQHLPGLLAENRCHVAAFLSVWPETYCYALSEAVRAGLYPVAFDLGAQARRIRELGWGAVLPLDSDPASINAALMRFATDHPIPHPDRSIGTRFGSILGDYLALEPQE